MAVRICSSEELHNGDTRRAVVDGIPVAVVRDDEGRLHAIGDTCSHEEISLAEGFVEGETIECWAHGAVFDLNTGAALTLPATDPVPVFTVSVVGGQVMVEPDATARSGCGPSCSCTHAEATA